MSDFDPLHVEQFHGFRLKGEGYLMADYIVNNTAKANPYDRWLLFMAGLGEGNIAGQHAAGVFDELEIPAVVLKLPLDSFEPTELNLTTVVNELPAVFANYLNQDNENPVDLMGNSQGGGAIIMTGSTAPEIYGSVDAIRPVGFNRQAFGITSDNPTKSELKKARRQFVFRLGVENALLPDQSLVHVNPRLSFDGGNVIGQSEVLANVVYSKLSGTLKGKLNAGLQLDVAQKAIDLHESGHDTTLWVGDRDPVFRLPEVLATLAKLGIDGVESGLVIPFPGSHSSIRGIAGTQQLQMVGEHYKEKGAEQAA